jgi:hypothetical protein
MELLDRVVIGCLVGLPVLVGTVAAVLYIVYVMRRFHK